MPESPVRLEDLEGEDDGRRYSPSAARNREEILPVFRAQCPADAHVLEIASGTGEHALYFCAAMPGLRWRASDRDAEALRSIRAWRAHAGDERIEPALELDVCAPWPSLEVDVVYVSNFFHITPWEACCALFGGAASVLRADGCVLVYGAFFREGVAPAPSNVQFDAELRARDPRYGVRRLEDVARAADEHGLALDAVLQMPRNNLFLRFQRRKT